MEGNEALWESLEESGVVPTGQDPFLSRGRAHECQAAAALPERHRRIGAAAGARTKPRALQIFPSKAQRKGITLNYQVPRNILLPFTLQKNYFPNNPLTALMTSVTYSPLLRESYLKILGEHALLEERVSQTGKCRVGPSFCKTETPLGFLVSFLIQRKLFSSLLSTYYSCGSPWQMLGAEALGENGLPFDKGLSMDLNSLTWSTHIKKQ